MTGHETPAGSMRRRLRAVPFPDVPRAALFECNGSVWRKVSTRTAVVHWPAGPARSFYFSKSDICHCEGMPK